MGSNPTMTFSSRLFSQSQIRRSNSNIRPIKQRKIYWRQSESSNEEVFINGMFRSICLKLFTARQGERHYQLDNGHLLSHFSDRISAFDVKMATLFL